MDADCIVIGGGFAGLAAADHLCRRGKRAIVLEARDRVGGRTATIALADGTAVDVGGQWLGPTQDRMYALCRRFGRDVYPMHVAGDNLLRLRGSNRRYRGHIPFRTPPWTLANLGWVLARLELMARRIPLEAPWQAPDAAALDQVTLGDWVRHNVVDPHARAIVDVGIEAVFAAEADELSLLHALFYMRSGGSFDLLTRSEGGAQQDRITGGVQPLAEDLAEAIRQQGGTVTLESPVTSIAQSDDGVTVESATGTLTAPATIVALPPPLAAAIDYRPRLSFERRELLTKTPMGSVIKCIAAYDRPFWRDQGFSGQAIADEGPMKAVFDASPKDARPALLMGFFEGAEARRFAEAPPEERQGVALDTFARFFGDAARSPIDYVDRAWTKEPFSRGCYAALFPPGIWTQFGRVIREPEGRIHWAGTETAIRWNGYIEGAVRSGERAATEILAREEPNV
jgi:monoamine oxidase